MGRVAVLGEAARVRDLGLAGAVVLAAETPPEVRLAWSELSPEIVVVVLTPMAAEALGPIRGPLTVVMADRAGAPHRGRAGEGQ